MAWWAGFEGWTHAVGNAILQVVSEGGMPSTDKYCVQYNNQYQSLPNTQDKASPLNLKDLSDIEGCDLNEYKGHQIVSQHTLVAVTRGNCSFTQKALVAQAASAKAVLVVNYENSSFAPVPGGNKTEFGALNITLAVIAWNDFQAIVRSGGQVRASLYAPPRPLWDANMIFIIFGSTLLVIFGGAWAAYSEEQAVKQRLALARSRSNNANAEQNEEEEGLPITVCGVLIWFAFICGTILLLYFFYDYMVYVFIALFCFVGAHSLYRCLLPLWKRIMPINYDIPLNRLPCFKSKWFSYFRDICSWWLNNNPYQIGGPGLTVEIDESLVAKRKNHVGRVIEQSDGWAAYNGIVNIAVQPPYQHLVVNHSENFVDPQSGACTNTIKCYWKNCKRRFKSMLEVHREHLSSHLDEFMWRELHGKTPQEALQNIMLHLSQWYPV
ncbi:hypothetical protein EGW08_021232 [Elysia chlorotica]|uniref:PA domain-containing protein n=1 Tax=Elysia chlorotica TaxID=188477 RepID=A0A433SP75_ELYCH|nr:hypothetical protein EGW08_021232 [Elysia chlorotica]